ncbi:MAG: hypothetical protein AMS27_02260 [Bacteroides sp. SM23_62_1]|nr:MAG: hypothetical protein AMS27_02260 [Bacteroides sp. SM23_62_1]
MKQIYNLIMILSLLLLASCGGRSGQTGTESDLEEDTGESVEVKDGDDKISNCDEFLDKYEEWMDEYLKFLEDYKNNPADVEISSKFGSLMEELGSWSTNWVTMYQCANEEKYQQRYEEIARKSEEKMKDLGFE